MRALALLLVWVVMAGAAEASANQLSMEQVARSVVFLHVPSTKQASEHDAQAQRKADDS